MRLLIQILNELIEKNLIEKFVLGGATALAYYAEAIFTNDVDIYVYFKHSSPLISLFPIYEFLKEKGYHEQDAHIIIEGIPVQFLFTPPGILEEGFKDNDVIEEQGTKIPIIKFEYLFANLVQLMRAKDQIRLENMFKNYILPDKKRLKVILEKYDLKNKLINFLKRIGYNEDAKYFE